MRVGTSALILALLCATSAPLVAEQQPAPPPAAVTLGELQRAAVAADPRTAQLGLLDRQSTLREENIRSSRLPAFSLDGLMQWQSDVPESPLSVPGGGPLFAAPQGTVDTYARLEQRLVNPARTARIAVEQAQLSEQRARVRASLYVLRQQVRETFFAVYGIRERLAVLGLSLTTLLRNRDDADARVRAGTAVPADVAEVDAALLDLGQESQALTSQMQGALQRIEMLTGRPVTLSTPLEVPNVDDIIPRSLSAAARSRPEFAQFTESRTRLSRQIELVAAEQKPRVSAFGRLGYGRPGLNFIGDRWDVYGLVGLQVQWRPDTWGTVARERQALDLQRQIVEADEAAFRNGIEAMMPMYIYPLQRLSQAIDDDARIIALREQVERTANVRLQAGTITMAEYLVKNTELMQARSARAARRVELAQKAAEMMDVAGVEIP